MIVKTFGTWAIAIVSVKHSQVKEWLKNKTKGGKKLKQRVTIAFFDSAGWGEIWKTNSYLKKQKPLMVLQKLLQNVTKSLIFQAQNHGCKQTLSKICKEMQIRSVILFMNNATMHPESLTSKHSNIKIVYLSKSTTSRLQPLDAGIIKNLKVKYRDKFLRYVLPRIADDRNACEIANEIDVIQAIEWMTSASKGLSKDTIKNCFTKCDVAEHPASTDDEDEELQINGHIAADDTLILIKRFVHHFNT